MISQGGLQDGLDGCFSRLIMARMLLLGLWGGGCTWYICSIVFYYQEKCLLVDNWTGMMTKIKESAWDRFYEFGPVLDRSVVQESSTSLTGGKNSLRQKYTSIPAFCVMSAAGSTIYSWTAARFQSNWSYNRIAICRLIVNSATAIIAEGISWCVIYHDCSTFEKVTKVATKADCCHLR